MQEYKPVEIEKKWQKFWNEKELFKADSSKKGEKKYILSMFPYPSGALHMGHVMNYTISDVLSRYYIMNGYNVLSPIGWDSFGLPAENAAIKQGIHPSENIEINIAKMKEQMESAGWGFDWDRELATSNEDYYKWTQWLFLKFYEAGLVEQKKAPVNWCPSCHTVLANEQVHDGSCERCGTEVEQKDLTQWFFLMSKYSQKLLDGHTKLGEWPEKVIKMQKDWIGRSEGAHVNFKLENSDETLSIFTTRPDTLFGVTFMSMAPQHPMVEDLIADNPEQNSIMEKVKKMRAQGTSEVEMLTREKEGVFTGRYAINPVNGDRVPIYIANFVLMNYGTGIVMAVPAHDQRDFEFAKKYDIDIKVVISPEGETLDPKDMTEAYVDNGLMVNSGEFTEKHNRKSMHELIEWLDKMGYGNKTVNYKLRDWLLSRQRYWGAPIPIVHCEKCGTVPVPAEELPLKLPKDVDFKPTGSGKSPLASHDEFMNTSCPKCGGAAKRESDTMDTFVDSSWYYLRYASAKFADAPFDKKEVDFWAPVDIYIGGIEHATMHLIYFRFFALVMKELGLIDFDEPVKRLFTQGMVCMTAHYCNEHKWLAEEEVVDGKCKHCGEEVRSEVTKMSKTKLNVISPEVIIDKYGADTMRMYILSDNPPDKDQVWSEDGVAGIYRYLNRVWNTVIESKVLIDEGKTEGESDKILRMATHNALKNCIHSYEKTMLFNTAIARMMELLNAIRKENKNVSAEVLQESVNILIKLLASIAPHMTEELWAIMGNRNSVFDSKLPEVDESALVSDSVKIIVQVNGKMRGNFDVSQDITKDEIEVLALKLPNVVKFTEGLTVRKVIVIPKKLVNIVVN